MFMSFLILILNCIKEYMSFVFKKTENLHVLLCTLFLSDFIEHIIILDCSISNMDIN